MEQVLLGVAGAGAEMSGGKAVDELAADSPAREIKLPERFHHPDIHRERGLETAGEQEDTISDLSSDTGQ